MTLANDIKREAVLLGFDLVGITDASPLAGDQTGRILNWLDAGYAGEMTYMHRNLDRRTDPAKLLPGAASVIVVGLSYKPPAPPLPPDPWPAEAVGSVAAYAQYEDYHPFMKRQLRNLVDFIARVTGPGLKFQVCVDSAPLAERALAARAGLGFIGKNHMLINPRLGPQVLLGEIVTNLRLGTDTYVSPDCGDCSRCVAACPTGALRPDGCFDATKCISYLTIVPGTQVPSDLAPKVGNHLFGCCECLLACPFQQQAPPRSNKDFNFYPDRAELPLAEVLNLSEDRFRCRFSDSPILRPGLEQLKRTARICLQNLSTS